MHRLKVAIPAVAAACAHGLRMAVNLVIIKLIAVYGGPVGMGQLGNFMSLTTIVNIFSGGGVGAGITKYVAEYRSQPRLMLRFIGAAVVYGLVFSVVVFVVCLFGANWLSFAIFGKTDYAWLVICLAVAHFLSFIGVTVVSVINGLRRPDLFAIVTLTGYLGVIPVAYVLVSQLEVVGAALALMLVTSCLAFPALWIVKKSRLTRLVKLSINGVMASRLAKFSLMLLVSAIVVPVAEIVIRTWITEKLGYASAGYWQAMNRLSVAYIGFFSVFLSTDYMPKLSALKTKSDRIRMVRVYLVRVALMFLAFTLAVYVGRRLIIETVFSTEFAALEEIIVFQLVGDLFRVCSYVVGFLTVAMALGRWYVAGEIFQMAVYLLISWLVLSGGGGLMALAKGYALTYFIYFAVVSLIFLVYARSSNDHRTIRF